MTSQPNDTEFKQMISKFKKIYIKMDLKKTTNDEIGRTVVYSIFLPKSTARLHVILIRTKVYIL